MTGNIIYNLCIINVNIIYHQFDLVYNWYTRHEHLAPFVYFTVRLNEVHWNEILVNTPSCELIHLSERERLLFKRRVADQWTPIKRTIRLPIRSENNVHVICIIYIKISSQEI